MVCGDTQAEHYDNWRSDACSNARMSLPEHVSPAFKALMSSAAPHAARALRQQVVASDKELHFSCEEHSDPLGESRYCVTPYLVHQYYNRVLLLSTGRCISYCRYCFRREFTARSSGFISKDHIKTVCAYLTAHDEVQEVLVSGGDPMSGSFGEIQHLLRRLRSIRSDLLIRLCTRAPIFAPELFTEEIIALLRSVRPLWVIAHINHPAELGKPQRAALARCVNAGLPVQTQTVLLHGVNDEPSTLAELFHALVCMGIKPGYLFQTDLAHGTAHFRVPLGKAARIWKALQRQLSGLSLPQFAVDLPDGGGKFPLSALIRYDDIISPLKDNRFSARGIDGKIYTYPNP